MEQVRAITVSGVQYNVAQATAIEQKRLMLLLGAKIALNSARGGSVIDTSMLLGALLTLPEETFDEISGIVLRKAIPAGTTTPVEIGSFQGGMHGYFKLVAESIAFNLNDFFTWLDSENNARRATVQSPTD